MELVDFFIGEFQEGLTPEAMTSPSPRLVMIDGKARRGVIVERCKEAFATIPFGGYLAVVIQLETLSHLRRLASFLTLRFHLLQVKHALAHCGVIQIELYGVSPNLQSPTIIYPLASAAARYAQANLLPASLSPCAILRKALAWWAGCDVSLGAVLVIGRKP